MGLCPLLLGLLQQRRQHRPVRSVEQHSRQSQADRCGQRLCYRRQQLRRHPLQNGHLAITANRHQLVSTVGLTEARDCILQWLFVGSKLQGRGTFYEPNV